MTNFNIFCKKCGSVSYKIVKTPETFHDAKYVCNDCDSFIQWKPKENNFRSRVSDAIEKSKDIKNNSFVTSLHRYFEQKKTLTPKQYESLCKIIELNK
jgi:transcription initiation factor TFIIIB Brf1 subunit/transcription initiation factor TFIIB